jgi:hypothetical protein
MGKLRKIPFKMAGVREEIPAYRIQYTYREIPVF